ncbi:MAG: hypothetical protein GC189_02335 [Alphaproteobacteria bacterium]|nr:hypothetical protein [Alphaproteobacteria bacterium]
MLKFKRFRRQALRRGDLSVAAAGFLLLMAVGLPALGEAPSPDLGAQAGIAVRVIDGDTVEVRGTGERVRLANIDAPEAGDGARCSAERAAAARATAALEAFTARGEVTIRPTGRIDRYGRVVGYLMVDGADAGQALMAQRLARPWRGRRAPWCGADGTLLGIE